MSHLYRRPKKDGIYWYACWKNNKLYRRSLKTRDPTTAKYLQAKHDQESQENRNLMPDSSRNVELILSFYEASGQGYKKPKTISNDNKRIKDFFDWGKIELVKDINDSKFQEYLQYRITKDKISIDTANRIIISVKSLFNFAVRRGMIPYNPVSECKQYPRPKNPPEFLRVNEIIELLNASRNPSLYIDKNPTLYPIILTALYTGMRQQEIFTLEWQDIDLSHNAIILHNKDNFTIKDREFRVIPLHSELKTVLLAHKRKSTSTKPHGRVFDTTNWRRIWYRIRKEAKMPKIGFQELRHSLASHLLMNSKDLSAVQDILGHSDPKVTRDHYAYLLSDHLSKAMETISFKKKRSRRINPTA